MSASRLRRYDLQRMVTTEPPKVPWVIRPLAALGEVTVLYGAPGLGKSLLCLALADAVSRGVSDAGGLRCNRAKPIYIDAENGEWETHRRVQLLSVDAERLAIYDAVGADLIRDFEEIEQAVADHSARLVVLDSLRRLLPGAEENDSGAMAEALGLCKLLAQRQRTAVVVIHHPKKSGEAYRGSSAIADQTSILYRLDKVTGDFDPLRRSLTNEKMRIAAPTDRRFVRVGVEDGELVLDAAFPPGAQDVAAGPAQSDMAPQVVVLLDAEPMTRAAVARALGRSKSDNTVRRTFDKLEQKGQIEQDDDGLWHRVAKQPLPSSNPNGNPPVANSVATGNPHQHRWQGGVAKERRARQRADGNPKRKTGKRS